MKKDKQTWDQKLSYKDKIRRERLKNEGNMERKKINKRWQKSIGKM